MLHSHRLQYPCADWVIDIYPSLGQWKDGASTSLFERADATDFLVLIPAPVPQKCYFPRKPHWACLERDLEMCSEESSAELPARQDPVNCVRGSARLVIAWYAIGTCVSPEKVLPRSSQRARFWDTTHCNFEQKPCMWNQILNLIKVMNASQQMGGHAMIAG